MKHYFSFSFFKYHSIDMQDAHFLNIGNKRRHLAYQTFLHETPGIIQSAYSVALPLTSIDKLLSR